MASFEKSLAMVLRHEGGLALPSLTYPDPGGVTNFGISQNVYGAFIGRPATEQDMREISVTVAGDIYKRNYWNLIRGDSINDQGVADWVMDMAVLRGVQAASKAVQTVLGVVIDGAIGPKTLAALNSFGPNAFLLQFYKLCVAAFIGIVVQKSNQLIFLSQWTRRANEMLDSVTSSLKR